LKPRAGFKYHARFGNGKNYAKNYKENDNVKIILSFGFVRLIYIAHGQNHYYRRRNPYKNKYRRVKPLQTEAKSCGGAYQRA
jgi:hypothetical protein